MLFHYKNLFDFEKKSVFIVNFILIFLIIIFFLFKYELKYFFYFDVILTFILSYIFFKKSRKLAKMIIVTNMFIFFYFLYPLVADFLTKLFAAESYVFIIFYNLFISYLFLSLSGYHSSFSESLKKFSVPIFLIILIYGICFGLFFHLIKEPVPALFLEVSNQGSTFNLISFLLFNSFLIAFSEQMIFSGFLFNVYKNLTTKVDAYFQVAVIFVMFHILRFETLLNYYFTNFKNFYIFYLSSYYILLFLFMLTALYLYSFQGKKHKGSFYYPLALHFGADFGLFFFYIIAGG